MATDASRLNAVLDRAPRLWFDVGNRRVPAFRSLGIVGFHLALLVAVAVALATEVPVVSALGLSAAAGASFFAYGLLRRAITGHEALVLLEYVWVGYGVVAAFAWASGLDAAPLLDVFSVAVPWFLAFGRLGCTVVGCCHGTPAAIGLRYGPEHGLPPRLTGRRLFPVQPLEGAALVAIGVVAAGLATIAAGAATVWFLLAYAVVRFGCERLRGDPRPELAGMPVARTMCVLQALAGLAAAEYWLTPGAPGRPALAAAVVLAAVGVAAVALLRSRPSAALLAPEHLDEAWELVRASEPHGDGRPALRRTSMELAVGVSPLPGGARHVSLSHQEHDALPVALALGGHRPVRTQGVVHLVLDLPGAPDPSGPPWVEPTTTPTGATAAAPRDPAYYLAPPGVGSRDAVP